MNVHVIAVYFPVGLLTMSVVFDLVAQVVHRDSLRTAGWWTLLSGVAFTVAALVTGIVEAPMARATAPGARTALDVHRTLAYVATILFGILLLWRLAGQGRIRERWRPAYLTAGVIGALLLLATVYVGIRSVYVYAAGIPEATLRTAVGAGASGEAVPGATVPGRPRLEVPPAGADTLQPDTGGPGSRGEDTLGGG